MSSESIIQKGYYCYLCSVIEDVHNMRNLEQHHIFHGTANRKIADRWGCWCYLCVNHHRNGPDAVHRDNDIDTSLKKIAQLRFEQLHGHQKFMELFGKNYL